MDKLVKVVNDVPVVSTLDMYRGLKVDHRTIIKLIKKYETDFQDIRTFGFEILKSGGRPTPYCYLDEEQVTFLITLMRNSDVVVPFKRRLTKEFYRLKKTLAALAAQQQNAQWLETRNIGKAKRRIETDTVQRFVAYAVAQGSKNAQHYYENISKMENKALFLVEQKYKNIRDILDISQLYIVSCADGIVTKALEDGMARNLNYKEIYLLAKTRIETFAEVHGKTIIPSIQGTLTA